jgi:hypothetical protein
MKIIQYNKFTGIIQIMITNTMFSISIDDHITYQKKVIDNINNNSINYLSLTCAPHRNEIHIYKQTLHALKTNTSITTLNVTIDYTKSYERAKEYDEWSGILCDVFKVNTTIRAVVMNIINMTKNGLTSVYEGLIENRSIYTITIFMESNLGTKVFTNNNKMLVNMLKTNNHLEHLILNFRYIDNVTWSNIMESLKINKTITKFTLTLRYREITFNGGQQLKELLQNNNTITHMDLCTHGMINYDEVISAIKRNSYIVQFIENSDSPTTHILRKVQKYCCRNRTNSYLKAMMLQDF